MSCFIVDAKTIDRIVTTIATHRDLEHVRMTCPVGEISQSSLSLFGQALLEENVENYNYRYGASAHVETEVVPTYNFKHQMCSDIVALDEVSRLIYQCSELPEKTPLLKWLEELENSLLWCIVRRSSEWRLHQDSQYNIVYR